MDGPVAGLVDGLAHVGVHAGGLSLPYEGPAVHLELRQSLGGQRHGLVQQLAHAEVDAQPGGVVGRGLETQPRAGAGSCHPARLQLRHTGQVRAEI